MFHQKDTMFYLLSLLSGILEIGFIMYGVVNGFSYALILYLPLAYQLGNNFPKPITLRKPLVISLSITAVAVSLFSVFAEGKLFYALLAMAVFCCSVVLQSIRTGLKTDGNRLAKRGFRVLGFLLSPLMVISPSAVLVFISGVLFFFSFGYKGKTKFHRMGLQGGFSVVMLFHQLHYFFYAHITLAAVCYAMYPLFGNAGTVIASVLFLITWVVYMLVEPVVSRYTKNNKAVFFIGHIGITALLLVMSGMEISLPFLLLWIITGLGGGVVYTISELAKEKGKYDKTSMDISENIGHVLGTLTAMIVAILAGDSSPKIMLASGAASAFVAVIAMAVTLLRKEK